MITPPPPYSVRRARFDESAALIAMITLSDSALGASQSLTEDDLLDDWRRDDFDLARDTWVIEHPDEGIVGYANLAVEGPSNLVVYAVVHAGHRSRGLGSYLLDRVEEAALRHPRRTADSILLNIILPGDEAAVELLTGRGYSKERTFLHMEIALGDFEPAEVTRTVSIRPFDPSQSKQMHQLVESAFEKHWDYHPTPFQEWWDRTSRNAGYDPTLWWWAEVDGRPAGAVLAGTRAGKGWVMDLGVLEQWRGRGAGAALLQHALAEFKRRGYETVGLNVDAQNETGAVRLYERVGMTRKTQFDFYKRVLPAKIDE